MPRAYTKMEQLAPEVFKRKEAGQTNREIADSFGLTLTQIKQLVSRQNRKERRIKEGYVPQPKGRPRKGPETEEIRRKNELVNLKMQVELLRNFLSECGRR